MSGSPVCLSLMESFCLRGDLWIWCTACEHVAHRRILRGSSPDLQLGTSHLCRRDSRLRAVDQRPANKLLLSVPDGLPGAGLVPRVVSCLPCSWGAGGQQGRVGAERAAFLFVQGVTDILGCGTSSVRCSSGYLHGS